MRKFVKVVLIVMSIISTVSLVACGNKDKAAEKVILKQLKSKYNEEFVVDSIGGGYGTLTTNTLKAECYPKGYQNKKFKVEITKDLKTVWDSYMNVVMAEKLDKVMEEIAKKNFGQVTVKTMFDTRMAFPEASDKGMSLKEYYKATPVLDALIFIFIKCDSDINTTKEAEKIKSLSADMINEGINNSIINIFYMKPDIFNNAGSDYYKLKDIKEIYKYYTDASRGINNSWVEIEQGKLVQQNTDEIKNNFRYK